MPKILIVDHDECLVGLHTAALSRDGYEVIAARGAAEAIESFEAEAPELVVLNLSLRCRGGISSLMTFFDRHPEIPIVVHAGGLGRGGPEWTLTADARLVNSMDTGELRRMVRTLLDCEPSGEVVPFAKPASRRRR